MSDLFTPRSNTASPQQPSNIPVRSVSDVATGVKQTLENAFGRVRIRGEISRPNYHRSGHLYLTLKDEKAVIDAVAWKGQVNKLGVRAEEGMEVIATGKITTFIGGSKYQLMIENMEIAGEGALLKMLEDRRKKLTAEGLFADDQKQPLPMLPDSIGVVTSPTGAVIRDILHRLADRFPRNVLLWPVSVQGENAAPQIAKAINGFNELPIDGPVKRPDILIVGRGGGSLEDLWCFNEEIVVRAVAKSRIPIISAVGHETDTTLIDFAADKRAPTPTGAAEMAVPVRQEELIKIGDFGQRLNVSLRRITMALKTELAGFARGLAQPERLINDRQQLLDMTMIKLEKSVRSNAGRWQQRFDSIANRLPHPRTKVQSMIQALKSMDPMARMHATLRSAIEQKRSQIDGLGRLLSSVQTARQRLMDQGYIYATAPNGRVIDSRQQATDGLEIKLHFRDGTAPAYIGANNSHSSPGKLASKQLGSGSKQLASKQLGSTSAQSSQQPTTPTTTTPTTTTPTTTTPTTKKPTTKKPTTKKPTPSSDDQGTLL